MTNEKVSLLPLFDDGKTYASINRSDDVGIRVDQLSNSNGGRTNTSKRKRCCKCYKVTLLTVNIGILLTFGLLAISLFLVTRDLPNVLGQVAARLIDNNLKNLGNELVDKGVNDLKPVAQQLVDDNLKNLGQQLLDNNVKTIASQLVDDNLKNLGQQLLDNNIKTIASDLIDNNLQNVGNQVLTKTVEPMGKRLLDYAVDEKLKPIVDNVLENIDQQVTSAEEFVQNTVDNSGDSIVDWLNGWLPDQIINVRIKQ